jgi:O-antigen/teichoic acid export membrane protein
MNVSRVSQLGEGVILKTSANAFRVFAGLTVSVLLNRVYGQEQYGTLILVYSVVALGSVLSDFGTKTTLIRFVPLWLNDGDEQRAVDLFGASVLIQLAGIITFGTLMFVSADLVATHVFLLPGLTPLIHAGVIYFAAFALLDFSLQVFQALQDWRRESFLTILFGHLQIASVCVIGLVARGSIEWILVGNAVAAVTAVGIAARWLPPSFRRALVGQSRRSFTDACGTVARFGLLLSFQGLYLFAMSWIDKILLGRFSSPGVVALYYIASTFLDAFVSVFKVLPAVLAPYIAEISSSDMENLRRKFTLVFRWSFQASVLVSLGGFFAIEPVVSWLYGPSYAEVVVYARALLIVFLLRTIREPLGLFLTNAFSQVRVIFIVSTSHVGLQILATAVLVPPYGVWGAIGALLTANVVSVVLILVLAPIVRAMIPAKCIWASALSFVSAAAVFGVLRGSALPMVVVGALVLIGYVAVLAALRELRAADLRVPMEILRNQRLLPIRTRSGAG